MAKSWSSTAAARGRERWAAVLADLERSGLSVASYSREHGLSARTLSWWRWALKARPLGKLPSPRGDVPARRGGAALSFVPVHVLAGPSAPDDGGLQVVLGGGRRIEVRAGFDGATLERLVRLLEAMSC